jgi:lipopolysaccharide transport system ATP-binding protein
MTVVISVENLSKAYRLGQIGTGTLSHDLNLWWAKIHGRPNPTYKIGQENHRNWEHETIWALKDINLQIEKGDALGIIGRNGAGKSTLLKILSRVTAPTSGRVKVKGRIASLLEVGTGFHQDLTGKENIFLNGAILGMNRKEIQNKFDAMVDFAEIEKFIDTPVKRYSTGMFVRLAFAVAAYLDPEILLIDEVLAVGDSQFQKKCLGKMGDVAHEGRTVLFVSHNMAAIRTLCNKGLLLKKGELSYYGDIINAISKYSDFTNEPEEFKTNQLISFGRVKIRSDGEGYASPQDPFSVSVDLSIGKEIHDFKFMCIIQNGDGLTIVNSEVKNQNEMPQLCKPGVYTISVDFPALWLRPGIYSVFFKMITASGKRGAVPILSDNIILDINGEVNSVTAIGSLTPYLNWNIINKT